MLSWSDFIGRHRLAADHRPGYGKRMDLSVVFLGTGGSIPTARRATACLLAQTGGERLLFDCGEGSQRQMQRSTGLVQIDEIFITHYHADHYLGVPGLLKTYDLQGRERPLRIVGPPGLIDLFRALGRIIGRISYEVELVELGEGEAVRHEGYEVRCFGVDHQVRAYGYALVEDERPGRFDPEAAERLGVKPGPDFGRLQSGETVSGSDGAVHPEQVLGEPRRGRKVVVTGDTAPCEMVRLAAHEAELLVHDGSFADEEIERAVETRHSTARQAAKTARDAQVRLLALVHISTRYDVREVLSEAREEFEPTEAPHDFDVVEIPFPERGEPRLIESGARAPAPA
jgi:ribonuclease Z